MQQIVAIHIGLNVCDEKVLTSDRYSLTSSIICHNCIFIFVCNTSFRSADRNLIYITRLKEAACIVRRLFVNFLCCHNCFRLLFRRYIEKFLRLYLNTALLRLHDKRPYIHIKSLCHLYKSFEAWLRTVGTPLAHGGWVFTQFVC